MDTTKEVYIIASELDNTRNKSNIVIECIVPQSMTMHTVYESLKNAVRDFATDPETWGKDVIEQNSYVFDWEMFANYIKTDRTIKYGIEIGKIIPSAPSVDVHENLIRDEDLDIIYPEGLL